MIDVRLIDVDALMEAINTYPKFGVDERCRIVPWNERYEPYIRLRDAVIAITGMPTIEPERKKGKWIAVDDYFNRISGRCSACGWEAHMYEDDVVGMNYCPNCGADMRGDQDED